LVQGVGYTIIYCSESRKYELSAQETYLRRTLVIDGERREILYERVNDFAEIDYIEFKSERWEQHGVGNSYRYIVMEQRTAAGKLTGYIKVVPKHKADIIGTFRIEVKAKRTDWVYYKRSVPK